MDLNDERYHKFATVVLVASFLLLSSFFHGKLNTSKERDYLFVTVPSSSNETYEALFPANTDSVVIPLKKAGRLLLIDATVEDQTGNLVFDTGANGLVLNSTYFRNHVRTTGNSTGGITGAVGKVERISVEEMKFGNLKYPKMRADLVNLGHIENRRGVKILGLVGFSMMKNLEIVLNAENGELRLYKLDKSGNRISGKVSAVKPDYNQRIESNGNVLFLKGAIAGKSLNFCFDTGAETNAISSDANKNILSTLTITRRMELKGAGSAKSEVLFGRMNDFSMGGKQITGMETIVTSLFAMSEAYNTKVDGMLGYSFLEQGTISINFVKRQFGINFKKESGK
ncbi:MAG TPA: hypothetical protein DER09_13260 [Prolixibacteraceae bacterium]|nr:hypothetical protein [Prolixibacteraceae bacterium]